MRFTYQFGYFEIDSMPNQPELALCHSFAVFANLRGKGYGHRLKAEQELELIKLGYSAAICTVQSTNKSQLAILEKSGWKHSAEFYDNRSMNQVFVYNLIIRR